MEYLNWLLTASKLRILRYDQIYVHIGMYEVTVHRPPDCALNAHQTMFLRPLEHSIVLKVLGMSRVFDVSFNPTNILAATEAPFLEAFSAHV